MTYRDATADSLDRLSPATEEAAQRFTVQKCLRRFLSDRRVPFVCAREMTDEVGDRGVAVVADKYVLLLITTDIVVGDRGLAPRAGSVYSRGTS